MGAADLLARRSRFAHLMPVPNDLGSDVNEPTGEWR
jgi:hypothetical protein